MKINFVTSFNENLYNKFVTLFFKSIHENWEPSLKLKCFYHDCNIGSYNLTKDNVLYESIDTMIADYDHGRELIIYFKYKN